MTRIQGQLGRGHMNTPHLTGVQVSPAMKPGPQSHILSSQVGVSANSSGR